MKTMYAFFAGSLLLLLIAGCNPNPGNEKIAYGKRMTDSLACYKCHSASANSINEQQPEQSKGYMGGGNKLYDATGKELISPNITFDETGIARWTEANFKQAIQQGVTYDGYRLNAIMPRYTALSDHQIACIYAYLATVPKIKNKTF